MIKGKKALILEGGGFKTGFTAGVMDAFHDANFRDFDIYAAVSGGTVALSYFLSEQRHYYIDALCHLVDDKHFVKMSRAFNKAGIMDIDYFYEVSSNITPFDFDTAIKNSENKELAFVLTHLKTGAPLYYRPNREDWISASIGSCTLPLVTKGKHKFNGEVYFDGGWSDAIPVKWAYEQGATEIIIVRTKNVNEMISKSLINKIAGVRNITSSTLRRIFNTNHIRYNDTLEFIKNPPEGLTIHQIAPKGELASGSITKSKEALKEDHATGLKLGNEFLNNRQ